MKSAWLAAPAVLVVAVLFAGGLALAILGSLPASNYDSVLHSVPFRDSLLLTTWVATLSTGVSAVLGLLLALVLRNGATQTSALNLQAPVVVPHLAFALAAIHLLAPSGLVARALLSLGLIDSQTDFPTLLHDRYGIGIVFVYIVKETPFLALLCLAILLRMERGYEDTARTLGASRLQRLLHVTLPTVSPALGAGSAVVFAFVFSAFEVPWLLGRTYPPMLGIMAQSKFTDGELAERPEAMAVALLSALIAVAVIALGAVLAAHAGRQLHRGTSASA